MLPVLPGIGLCGGRWCVRPLTPVHKPADVPCSPEIPPQPLRPAVTAAGGSPSPSPGEKPLAKATPMKRAGAGAEREHLTDAGSEILFSKTEMVAGLCQQRHWN